MKNTSDVLLSESRYRYLLGLEIEIRGLKEDRQRRDLGTVYPTKEVIEVQIEKKSIVESKTVWFNIITAVIAGAGVIPPPFGIILSAVGNIILRVFFTDKPVKGWI